MAPYLAQGILQCCLCFGPILAYLLLRRVALEDEREVLKAGGLHKDPNVLLGWDGHHEVHPIVGL